MRSWAGDTQVLSWGFELPQLLNNMLSSFLLTSLTQAFPSLSALLGQLLLIL